MAVAQPVGEGQHVSVRHCHLEVFVLEVDGELQGEGARQGSLEGSPGWGWRAIAGLPFDLTLTSDPGLKHM